MIRLLLTLLLLFGAQARGGEVLSTAVDYADKRYFVELVVLVDAPVGAVHQVMTDYDQLTRINDAIKESEILFSTDKHTHRVRTRTESCVLFFCVNMLRVEDVEELPNNIIIATMVGEQSDFRYGHSRWKITPENDKTRVSFNSDLQPDFWVPPLIGPFIVKRKLREESLKTAAGIERLAQQVAIP